MDSKQKELRVAIHEAGHAIVSYIRQLRFEHVTIEPQDDSLGHVLHQELPKYVDWETLGVDIETAEFDSDEELECLELGLQDQVRNHVIVFFAGSIAEVRYRKERGLKYHYNRGSRSDFQQATDWLFRMVGTNRQAGALDQVPVDRGRGHH